MKISSLIRFVTRLIRLLLSRSNKGQEGRSAEPAPATRLGQVMVLPLRAPGDITEPRKRLHDECFALGLRAGEEGGRKDPHEPTLKLLEAAATSIAETVHSRSSAAREHSIQSRLLRLQEDEGRLQDATDVAAANARDRRHELAELGPRTLCPAVSTGLARAATLGLSFSLAVPAHDLMPLESALRWPAAALTAFGLAQLIVEGILPHGPSGEAPKWIRHGAFIGSLALNGAFLYIRREAASSSVEYGLAYGLALAEASITLILEAKARGLQPRIDHWHEDEGRRRRAELLVTEAEDELQLRQERVRAAQAGTEERLDALEKVSVVRDLGALNKLAVAAVRQGYFKGITANDVSVRGLSRKEAANGVR